MPRYNRHTFKPRSRSRWFEMRKRNLLDRSQKDDPRDRSTYTGYAVNSEENP